MNFSHLFNIAKKAFGFGVIPKIPSLINLFLLPIITPYLTPYDYGIWGIITSYSAIFAAVAPLGLNLYLTNSYYEYKNHWYIIGGKVLFYFYISGAVLTILFGGIIFTALPNINSYQRFAIAILGGIPILVFGNATEAQHLYPLKGTPTPLVWRNLIASLIGIICTFILIYFCKVGFWGFLIGTASSSIVSFLLFFSILCKKENIKPIWDKKWRHLKKMLLTSWPLIPHSLGFMLLSSSSRIMMNLYEVPIEDIGLFSNGYIMGDYLTIVTTSLVVAMSPQMQESYRANDFQSYRKLFYLCMSVTLATTFLASIWMPEIYAVVIRNKAFEPCSYIASSICFANVLLPFYNFTSLVAFIHKDTKQLLWLVFIPGLINIILCAICIPLFGYISAIYTTLISYWTIAIIPFTIKYYKYNTVRWLGKLQKILIILLIIGCSFILSRILFDQNWIIKIISMAIMSVAYLFIIKKQKICVSVL